MPRTWAVADWDSVRKSASEAAASHRIPHLAIKDNPGLSLLDATEVHGATELRTIGQHGSGVLAARLHGATFADSSLQRSEAAVTTSKLDEPHHAEAGLRQNGSVADADRKRVVTAAFEQIGKDSGAKHDEER